MDDSHACGNACAAGPRMPSPLFASADAGGDDRHRRRDRRRPMTMRKIPATFGRQNRALCCLLWLGLIGGGVGNLTSELLQLQYSVLPCEERSDERLCETDSQGGTDHTCVWVGEKCETFFLLSAKPWDGGDRGDRDGLATLSPFGIRDFSNPPAVDSPVVAPVVAPGPNLAPSIFAPMPTTEPTAAASTSEPPTSEPIAVAVPPSGTPTRKPTTAAPTGQPMQQPTTLSPTERPTDGPTSSPTGEPTFPPSRPPSRQPSGAPTDEPSLGPSSSPTNTPTQQPTTSPSKSPSTKPTSSPTDQPSASPTKSPSAKPTSMPTNQPTTMPSDSPSGWPSAAPSGSPTHSPSGSPTSSPSGSPSASPTNQPTGSPSASPTEVPTDSPTQNPTLSGRPTPLIWPSASPTASTMPTADPTSFPSASPSASPTGTPSASPTFSPSSSPSKTLTETPSLSPTTASPTGSAPTTSAPTTTIPTTLEPAATPVSNPPTPNTPAPVTDKPTVPNNSYEVRSAMTFYGAEMLDRDAIEVWVQETEGRIHAETTQMVGEEGNGLDVTVFFIDQNVLEGRRELLRHHDSASAVFAIDSGPSDMSSEAHNEELDFPGGVSDISSKEDSEAMGGYLRRLQASPHTASQLQIDFTTTIEFNSDRDDWDPNQMVAAGFESLNQQEEYLYALKAADASYSSVENMAMEVEGTLITDTEVPNVNLAHDDTLYYIVGGTVGGALVLLVAMVVVYKKKSPSRSRRPSKSLPQAMQDIPDSPAGKLAVPSGDEFRQPMATATTASTSQNYFGTIESREGEDDVSTLGDPYFGDGAGAVAEPQTDNTVTESMVSSEQRMFEYGVGRVRSNTGDPSTIAGGITASNPNLFGDDATYERGYATPDGSYEDGGEALQRLVVTAPAGKLGIVVDNPSGDVPIVHAIKETSALHGEVEVGDLLVSVDEIECRGMSAVQVSRLISSRMRNPSRALVLLRGSGGRC